MVPSVLPISSASFVTLLSGLTWSESSLRHDGPDVLSSGTVGWFPALEPTVITDTEVSEGASSTAGAANL